MVNIIATDGLSTQGAWGSFHYWESELTFGNLTNLWRLANQKVRLFHKKWAHIWG